MSVAQKAPSWWAQAYAEVPGTLSWNVRSFHGERHQGRHSKCSASICNSERLDGERDNVYCISDRKVIIIARNARIRGRVALKVA